MKRSQKEPSKDCRSLHQFYCFTHSRSPEWDQQIIFPEGATSNRKAILTFKPGGFIPGVPVQPVIIKYPNHHDTISWTWDQPHSALGCILYSMTQIQIRTEIHFLPRYVPSQEEINNAQLYADNVRKYMANYAGIGLCNLTYKEIKEMYTKKEI